MMLNLLKARYESTYTISILLIVTVSVLASACPSTEAGRSSDAGPNQSFSRSDPPSPDTVEKEVASGKYGGPSIKIVANSPADTVRAFYERLRNKQFRDAVRLTNLRPAIEGLSDDDMRDLGVDFGFLATSVPPQMPINGEIISGNEATVTLKMPNEKDGKLETHELRLRKEGNGWIMLVADPEGERMVRKEGKNYFFALRMEVHHREAQAMLERINKAQTIYSLQNDGKFADLNTLASRGYVPEDARSAATTGYKYDIALAFDRSTYTALATPAVYGKTGKLSFAMKIRRGRDPELVSRDSGGRSLKN